jgi:hypothetical protein
MSVRPIRRPHLSVEGLEDRSLPSSAPLLIEPFQAAGSSGLPNGWYQWSSNHSPGFAVDRTSGLGDLGLLTATAPSGVTTRAWVASPFPADVETSAAVYLNSLVPAQLFVRGKHLDTASPTYYAVSITRGLQVQLLRVVNGQTTVIGADRSADYVSGKWAEVTLVVEGNLLRVQVRRADTGRYLSSSGDWVSERVNAIQVSDSAIATAGQVGFARGSGGADRLLLDSLKVNQVLPESRALFLTERFDTEANGGLPDGWGKWSGGRPVAAHTTPDQNLRVDGPSGSATRLWINRTEPADLQVSSSFYVDSLVPAQLLVRGQALDTAHPTYYAVSVTRGLDVQLLRVVNGRASVLGELRSKDWISGQWLQVSLVVRGSDVRAQVFRTDTGQYLKPDGTWGLAPSWALIRADTAITRGGYVGLGRGGGASGGLTFDNFIVTSAPQRWDEANPIPTRDDKPTPLPPPPDGSTNPPPLPPPGPTPSPTPSPRPAPGLPDVPRNLSWIRLANLAYYGTPLGSTEIGLLRDKIDLVIPNVQYLDDIAKVSPNTPQLVYTNVSNMYLGMYTDWLAYADKLGVSREAAFYHATRPIASSGASASSVPVNQFWGVYRGTDGSWTNLTGQAKSASAAPFSFPASGQSLAAGYTEKFREINVSLVSAAAGSWAATLEYVSAVDAQGRPTRWSTLHLNADQTAGLRHSGRITFDPPKDWVAASVDGSARLFYVRFRTTSGGTAPVALTILGRDYTNSKGRNSGTIPAFDDSADKDHDGYLNDAEYAKRRPGFDARFVYETRVFYPQYGPNRFATNVSNPAFRNWVVNYHLRLAKATPQAAGFFVDNSVGKVAIDPSTIAESMAGYSADYGSLLGSMNGALAPKWLIANTAGGGPSAEPVIKAGVSYLEEFALRPLSANYVQFEDLAATIASRRQLSGGKSYEILDSLPTQGVDATNPRMMMSTLAMYYLLADPNLSFLMINGGNEPASSWSRHFTPAINYNVGKPLGNWGVFATGQDPTNSGLDFKVYSRQYQNALVLYKPVSYTRGASGKITDDTATTMALGGVYRELRPDGTLGATETRVSLRNGEGKILVRVG